MPATCVGSQSPDDLAKCLDSVCAASHGAITSGWVALSASPGSPSVQSIVCAVPATADTRLSGNTNPPPNAWIVGAAQITSSAVPTLTTPFCDAWAAASNGYQAPRTNTAGVISPALVLCTNSLEPFDFVAGPVNPPCSMGITLNVTNQPSTFIGTACRPPGGGIPGELGTLAGTCVLGSGSEITTYDEFCPPAGSFLNNTPPAGEGLTLV